METFSNLMGTVDDIVWCMALVVLCLGAGLYFSIRMKFPQIRLIKEMAKLLVKGEKSDSGITPFQAFAATVGSRVGMGNIAGVATAIYFGGSGAVFWMWCIAFIGASSAFIESSLAQAYKVKDKSGEYMGGPAYYIERALHCKPYVILLGMVVCGGIKRIGKIAEYMAPVMCVVYVALAVGVIGMNITAAPGVFKMIVSSAFGIDPIFGAIIGSAISWGVKRGIYSNEAGQGSGAIVSSSAECSHPAKQGLVQAFSGCILNGEIIWTMGDIGCGSMAWLNIIAILLLFNKGFALLKDYEKQKKEGKDPVFRPTEFGIEMIASESTAPLAVMGLTGSVFTNKTLEGYPGKRFQAGSHIADRVEELACQRACKASG